MNNLIGKTIKFQTGSNTPLQTGTVIDVSMNGSINVSGIWYQQQNILIIEVCDTTLNNESQQLILG